MKETIKNLKRVYKYGKEYQKNLIIFTLMSITFVIMNIIAPVIAAKQLVYLSENLYEQLLGASVIILILNIISAMNHWILRRNTQIFFRGTTKNIQLHVAKEILKIELSDIDKSTSGTFIQRIGSDTDEMSKIYTRGMGYLTNILTDIGIFAAIFIINKIVFIFFLGGSLLLTLIHLYKVQKVNEKDKKYRKQREKTGGLVSELVRGIRDIKMLHAKKSFIQEVELNIDALSKSQFDMRNTEMNYNCVASITSAVIQFTLIVLLVYLLSHNSITIATAIILYNYKSRVLSNLIEHIGNLMIEVKSFNLSSSRVFSIFGNQEFKKETFGKEHINKIKGNFEFKNVSFSYGENQVLQDLSFKVEETKQSLLLEKVVLEKQ